MSSMHQNWHFDVEVEAGMLMMTQHGAAYAGSAVHRWPVRTGWVLLGSCLEAAETQQLQHIAAASGSKVVKNWTDSVTHVLCHLSTQGEAKYAPYPTGQIWLLAFQRLLLRSQQSDGVT